LLYEAKVLKCENWVDKSLPEENGPHYFVHYKGWKQSWDEWVPETRALKHNEESLKRQADLKEAHTSKKKKISEKKTTAAPADSGTGTDRNRKRPRESNANAASSSTSADTSDDFSKRMEVKIIIPDELKVKLVDDWEHVTKNQKLIPLPRTPTVTEILEEYKEHCKKHASSVKNAAKHDDILNEVVDGLKMYFDKALGNILLYRFERNQYSEIKNANPDKRMSDIYGAEHLLRLFVQLPSLIAHTNMDQDAVSSLKDHFAEFLKYFDKQKKELFISEYENASASYISLQK
jgi:mortality factor 4-like protein 1